MDFGAVLKEKKEKEVSHSPKTSKEIEPKAFSLEGLKKKLTESRAKINEMIDISKVYKVEDDETYQHAIKMMSEARDMSKKLTKEKDKVLQPHKDFSKNVNSLTKFFTEPLEKVVELLRKKTEDYAYAKILEERKKEKEEREAREALKKKLDKEAEEAGVEKVELPDAPGKTDTHTITRTDSGSSLSMKMEWKGKIIDPDKVPRKYCVPVQKLIDTAVKAGEREIPGVEIKEVPKSRLRA